MDIQGPVITTYVYQLIDNDVRVEKVEFRSVFSFTPCNFCIETDPTWNIQERRGAG
jgi:hypothetical protein